MRVLKTTIVVAAVGLAAAAGPALARTPAAQTAPAKPAPAPAAQTPDKPAQAPRPFPEGAKIAFISLQFVASSSEEGKSATARIQEFTKKKQAELAEKQKAAEALRSKLLQGGGVMSDQARAQLEKEIEKLGRELQFAQQDAQAEQQELTAELQNEFQTKLVPIIDEVAKERGLHVVLSAEELVWADTGLDLSAEVIKRLDAASKTPAAPAKK